MGVFPVGVLFYWTALILGFYVIAKTFKNILLNFFILLVAFTFSVLNIFIDNPIIFFLSILSKSSILCLVAAITVIRYPKMLNWQILVFLVCTIPIMILQILGVSETVHALNTLFYTYDESGGAVWDLQLTNLFFTNSNQIVYNSSQARPPGLFHSNAILSPILLGFAAYNFSYSKNKNLFLTDILVLIAVVLVMSKISVLGIFLILLMTRRTNKKFKKTFFLLIVFYLLYWFFLPVFFINNLSLDAFYSSSYYRLIDLYIFISNNAEVKDEFINILSSELSFNYINESDIGGVSGIAKIIKYLPFFVVLLFIFRKRIFSYYKEFKCFSPALFVVSKTTLITLIICNFATPLYKAPMFGYFLGIALLPFLYHLFKNKFDSLKDYNRNAYSSYN